MGVFGGSMTFTTFLVNGELPEGFQDRFLTAIQRESFRALQPEEETEESIGWCSVEHPFDVEFNHDKVFYNSYVNLGMRIDRWRIPASLFKAHFVDAERAYLAKEGRERLTKRQKGELKVVVTSALRRQILPSMKVVDLCWNLDTGVLRFWSQSNRMLEMVGELFEETFGLDLVQHSPFIVAREGELDEDGLALLTTLEPTPFHAQVIDEAR